MTRHKGFEPNPLTYEEQDLLLFFVQNEAILYPKSDNPYGVRPATVNALIRKQMAKGTSDGYLTLTPKGKRWVNQLSSTSYQ